MARLDALLTHLKRAGGSDLHLAAGLAPRLRVRGFLEPVPDMAVLSPDALYELVGELAEKKHMEQWRRELDVDFAYGLVGVGRFRVNCFEQQNGPGAVFRLIPETLVPLEELGMPASLEKLVHYQSGLVLITGPTGSGKSTTLAAIIDRINAQYAKHVVTIEDPIEFLHVPKQCIFSQREVGQHARSFASAVRGAIREDADVILVGELRDPETIALALLAAEMGTLVFATLHTNSAPKTIDRLIDAFPADAQAHIRLMLSDCLAAVIAQLLIPTADGKGRAPAAEVLLRSSALPALVRDNNVAMMLSHMQSSRAQGMQTMDDALEALWRAHTITFDEALRRANDRPRLEKLKQARDEAPA